MSRWQGWWGIWGVFFLVVLNFGCFYVGGSKNRWQQGLISRKISSIYFYFFQEYYFPLARHSATKTFHHDIPKPLIFTRQSHFSSSFSPLPLSLSSTRLFTFNLKLVNSLLFILCLLFSETIARILFHFNFFIFFLLYSKVRESSQQSRVNYSETTRR